ncbi:IclR family transcriptional regulator [Arthrobacter caoxuetaonis]|uniref:Helix-turn-helix domain-containing protein n=1 Tax=Arthrobacter caoxuetaonis TaxID=2886935 RepID=A0A9X1MEV3_9MICC|nr:helix-turn-helix domain-containing protein [Arthrobacter caoxuetaonis]MCC3282918.1 helix-turn-helix domain-containing protein [Arthrobacter caoxuetaonis]MCC3298052.1 helix-turn-helix domain-containing protein [Arthrobacter caoxuetaonis]USQ57065.1 helix-turn-helix domain-containing protein [Arthrobacter caoxuetaonis]
MTSAASPGSGSQSQTLSRGIQALELLAEAETPLSIAELSVGLGVHRSIAYRILRTLEAHSLVMRDDAGRVSAAPGLAALARGVSRDLQSASLPELTVLANELAMTAFIAVWDQHDCVTLVTVEPRHSRTALVQRPGTRHSFTAGAPGIAIQSAVSEEHWNRLAPGQPYREEAKLARQRGYATSHSEVIEGVGSVAVPVQVPGQLPASLSVVYFGPGKDDAGIGARLIESVRQIEAQLH